jgi:hypothetical protein
VSSTADTLKVEVLIGQKKDRKDKEIYKLERIWKSEVNE